MQHLLLAAAGGAIGAGARHLVNVTMLAWLGPGFPWATLMVNVVGSLLMGAVVEALMPFGEGANALRVFLATGILGGFTTFSAFSLDAWVLHQRGEHMALVLYATTSMLISVMALVAGMALIRGLR